MSTRYSTSPSLHLAVANSSIHKALHCLLCLLTIYSLYLLTRRGYPLLALLLLPAATACCWRLARQRLVGTCIRWQQGIWTVEQASGCRSVSIHRSSTCLPWIIYLAWIEPDSARRGSVFLLPDSASDEQLRGLRVRLTLER